MFQLKVAVVTVKVLCKVRTVNSDNQMRTVRLDGHI